MALAVILMCKTDLSKHRHAYSCVPTRTNVYRRVWAMSWTIFDRTDMKISLYRAVLRIEFDGDVHFFSSSKINVFIELYRFFRCLLPLFRFPSFFKNLYFLLKKASGFRGPF